MDQETKTCTKCGGVLQPGFLMDKTQLTAKYLVGDQVEWIRGEPGEKSFWRGSRIYVEDKERRKVTCYCCDKCGFLEMYAFPATG